MGIAIMSVTLAPTLTKWYATARTKRLRLPPLAMGESLTESRPDQARDWLSTRGLQ